MGLDLNKYKFKNRLLLVETSNYTNENYKKIKEFYQKHIKEFENTMTFIEEHIPLGFKKTTTSNSTPRARYEAIAVGTALALREDSELKPASPVSEWITSEEFQAIVGADSANNTSQLLGRIDYVKNKLLGINNL